MEQEHIGVEIPTHAQTVDASDNLLKIQTALGGTEKQVKWAQDIRREAAVDLGKRIENLAVSRDAKSKSKAKQMYAFTKWMLEAKTDAKWWIDNRVNITARYGQKDPLLYALNAYGKEFNEYVKGIGGWKK